jgi:hypothetical protein
MQRIDQHLFKNIVKMSYEADKAWRDWLREYSNKSEKEKNAYISFASKIRRNTIFNNGDDDSLKIFNLWCDLTEKEKEKWVEENVIINQFFIDVETFLRMYQHNV